MKMDDLSGFYTRLLQANPCYVLIISLLDEAFE